MHTLRNKQGQSSLEMAFLFAIIILVLVAFQRYIRNAATGRLKSSSDSISQTLVDPHDGITSLSVNRVTSDTTTVVGTTGGVSTSTIMSDSSVRGETL